MAARMADNDVGRPTALANEERSINRSPGAVEHAYWSLGTDQLIQQLETSTSGLLRVDAAIRLDGTAVQIGDAAQIVTVSAGPGRAKERKRAGRGDAEEPAAKRQRRQETQGAGCSVELQPSSGESVVVRCSFPDSDQRS